MFPTDPILNYINLSFAKKSDELSKIYAEEVVAARLKYQSPSGMRLRAIMQPAVESARARINAWVQIVRDACKEANRPVDNEVRDYILAEVHNQCEGARRNTAHNLALTLQREAMQHVPNVRESLSANLDRQISQIETDIARELKIEELKENVQKGAKSEVSLSAAPKDLIPTVNPHIDNRRWYRKLSLDQKIALSVGLIVILIALLTLIVMITVPELRIVFGLDPEPASDPKISIPAPRPPSDQPAPKTPPKKDSATPVTRGIPAPTVQAIAPNGIANAAPNFGDQTVNNFGPRSRRITQQQHDEIVPMLTNDRARVIVWAYSTDTDTWGLAKDIYGALKDSGWSMEDPDVQAAIAVNPNECDVVVFIPGDPGQPVTQLPGASREVLTVLKSLGLTYKFGHSDKLGGALVKIVVGPR